MEQLSRCTGFHWDAGNAEKNQISHGMTQSEAEQVFFNRPLVVNDDVRHSTVEPRYFALGRTDAGRHLFIAFTLREDLIRVISARDMSRREQEVFHHGQTAADSDV